MSEHYCAQCAKQSMDILDILRSWLSQGYTISAADPDLPVLQLLPDGGCDGNLFIDTETTNQ